MLHIKVLNDFYRPNTICDNFVLDVCKLYFIYCTILIRMEIYCTYYF